MFESHNSWFYGKLLYIVVAVLRDDDVCNYSIIRIEAISKYFFIKGPIHVAL